MKKGGLQPFGQAVPALFFHASKMLDNPVTGDRVTSVVVITWDLQPRRRISKHHRLEISGTCRHVDFGTYDLGWHRLSQLIPLTFHKTIPILTT